MLRPKSRVKGIELYIFSVCLLYTIINYCLISSTDIPDPPVLTYKSTYNEILVSWSPVGSDGVCGPVTYSITVMPSHGMMMMINDTVYNITGLNNNTDYTITVYTSSNIGKREQTTITVKTLPRGKVLKCNTHNYVHNYIRTYDSNVATHMHVCYVLWEIGRFPYITKSKSI